MKKIYQQLSLFLAFIVLATQVQAQIATSISGASSAAGSYTSFESAITALNGSTITGAVTVDLTAGQTETLTGRVLITATGTSGNPITIQRSGAGANPKLISYVGTVVTPSSIADGMVVLVGSDYITIDGLDLEDNAANTTTTTVMEFGFGLFKASAIDGCQYNTIKNCTITLNRLQTTGWTAPGHQGSTGISIINALSTATGTVTVTAPSGSNSYNQVYSCTIQNCNNGITINGRDAAAIAAPYKFDAGGFGDTGNDIGGTSSATGNTIINFGGATGATVASTGIWAGDQFDLNIAYNTINNNNGAGINHPSTLRGIFLGNPVAPASPTANITCSNNNITIKGGGTTSQITGIESSLGAAVTGFTNTLNFNNNTIVTEYPTATSGASYGIYQNTSAATNVNMNNNTVSITSQGSGAINGIWNSTTSANVTQSGNTVTVTGNMSSAVTNCVYNSGAATASITQNNNNIGPCSFTNAAVTGTFRGVYNSTGVGASTVITMSGNTFLGLTYAGTCTGAFSAFSQNGTGLSSTISNNTLSNVTIPSSGAVRIVDCSNSSTQQNVFGNTGTNFTNNNATSSTSAFQLVYNFGSPASGTSNVYNNSFSNITCNRGTTTFGSSAGVMGIFYGTGSGHTHNVYNNSLNGITNNGPGNLQGIFIGYGNNNSIYGNTVTGLSSAGIVAGIGVGNSSTINASAYDNSITNITSTGGAAHGIVLGTATGTAGASGTVNVYENTICSVSSTAATGTANGIFHQRASTANFYNNVIGGITAVNSTSGTAVSGINVAATVADNVRIYFNTVHLTGTGATGFGSSTVMTTSAPTTTAPPNIDLRNNIFSNMTTPNGGLAVGFRRLGTTLTAFNAGSNNNMWYTGTPGASNLIFHDGTNSDQTLADYLLRVTPRETADFTADVSSNFLSTTCGAANFLRIDAAIPTQLEGGALTTTTPAVTVDIDGDTRSGTPDMGADEFIGITPAPSIAFNSITPGTSTLCTATDREVSVDVTTTAGTISDVQLNYSYNGVPQSPITMTNIGGDTYTGIIPAPTTPTSATVTWFVSATNTLSLSSSYIGSSYFDDLLSTLSVAATAGANPLCEGLSTTLTASASYPTQRVLGAGATTSATYSNPFYSLWSNTHNQHVILASELTAIGMFAGNISSLGLNITAAGTLPMLDFSMKIGTTTATNASAFITTPLTTVYTSASLLPVAGINMMNFTSPFFWDGTSNLVIEICHGNPASTTTMSRTCQADNTSFVSTIHTNKTVATSGSSQCTDNTTGLLTYTVRPRFYFDASISASNFVWNDGTSNIGTTQSIVVNPSTTTTYSASFDALGCSVSTPITLTVLPVPAAPTASNSTQCGVGIPAANVTSNAGALGSGKFYWYDAATNGNVVQYPPIGATLSTYYANDFSSSTLTSEASLAGNASITAGALALTPNATSQSGAFTVNGPGSYNPTIFQVSFEESNGPLGNADGFSYSFADDVSATGTTPTTAEYGTGSKLRVAFDTYGAAAGARGIYLFYGSNVINAPGQVVGVNGILAYSADTTWINASNIPVIISVDATGLCDVTVNGTPIFTGVQLPPAFASANKGNWKHCFKARSGGIAGAFGIDNLDIQTNSFATGSPTWLNSIATTTTWYVGEESSNGCNTLLAPVTATVLAPPALTVTTSRTICNDYIQELTVTSNVSDYQTFVWTPYTDLYTDPLGTSPYTGTSASTVYFRSTTPSATTYTLNANETINGCSNIANTTISVLPASIIVTSTPDNLCVTGDAVITFTPTSNLYASSLQWSSSPDGSVYTDIPSATATSYSVVGLTTSTYYRMSITDDNSTVCLTNDYQLLVNNPSIASTTPGTRCGTGTVNLAATASGAGIVRWYANPTGGGILNTGNSYTTPPISTTTNYYVSSVEGGGGSTNVASPIPGTATFITTTVGWGLRFSVNTACDINSVDVKCSSTTPGAASIQIKVTDLSDVVLYTGTLHNFTITNALAVYTIPVGISALPVGNYKMVMTYSNITSMVRESGGVTFPYNSPSNEVSITAGANGTGTAQTTSAYYWFYNWVISTGCESPRQLIVATVNTAPAITTANTTICDGQTSTLDVTSSNPDYTYTWMPGTLNGPTHSVNPSTTTTYTVTAIDNTAGAFAGCQLFATQTVTVNANPTISSATASPSDINPGCNTPVTLSATTSAPVTAIIGNPASTTTTVAAGITPYNSNWEGNRSQYIIQAAEMTAAGFTAGTLSSLGFDVTALGAGTFAQSGYTVKFAHTNDAAFAGAYATPSGTFTTVYGPVAQPLPTLGINTMTFATPFSWDGVSNILIDICHDNDIANSCAGCFSSSSTVRTTVTSFNSVYGRSGDNVQACDVNSTNAVTVFNTRPNIYFNGIAGQITTKEWNPGTLANPATVSPTTTTIYTVTCTNPSTGCTAQATATVTVNPDATLTGLASSYLVSDAPVTMTGTPSGGTFSGPGVTGSTFDPATAGAGTHTITYTPVGYCVPASVTVIVTNPTATLNLTCFIQGYYVGANTMNPVLSLQGLPNPSTDCDSITVELHDNAFPYGIAHPPFQGVLQVDGTLACSFPGAAIGNDYYLVVKHRSALETWSANPITIAAVTSYNFSTDSTQAYGDNMISVEPGVWAFYSGDLAPQDLSIDGFDYITMDPDIISSVNGYVTTDITGDGVVDAFDYLVLDPNIIAGITALTP